MTGLPRALRALAMTAGREGWRVVIARRNAPKQSMRVAHGQWIATRPTALAKTALPVIARRWRGVVIARRAAPKQSMRRTHGQWIATRPTGARNDEWADGHCEARSAEAIHAGGARPVDCHAPWRALVMTRPPVIARSGATKQSMRVAHGQWIATRLRALAMTRPRALRRSQ
jgi:hypothetical protein